MNNELIALEQYFNEHKKEDIGYDYYMAVLENQNISTFLDNLFKEVSVVNIDYLHTLTNNEHVLCVIELYLEMKGKIINRGELGLSNIHENDYYNSIKGYKVLTKEEEEYYFREYNKGSKEAFDVLLKHNLRLAYYGARIMVGKNPVFRDCFMDMVQEANIGLITAIKRFDVEKGARFSTYASWWIKQAVGRYLYDNSRTIRVPVHVGELVSKMNKYANEYLLKHDKPIDYFTMDREELAKMFDTSVETIKHVLSLPTAAISLYMSVDNESDSELQDFLPVSDTLESDEIIDRISYEEFRKMFESSPLSEREKEIIRKRFGLDGDRVKTLEEIAKEYGVTRERIRQIEAKALRKLRKNKEIIDLYGRERLPQRNYRMPF